jgi:molybdate transport system regulatory protein
MLGEGIWDAGKNMQGQTESWWNQKSKVAPEHPALMNTMAIKHILRNKGLYKVCGSLWLEFEGQRFFGPGRVELLERIDQTGSINQAAKQMRMSYKKAWEMITLLNTQAKNPLVIIQTGGEKGGGSIVTKEAKELIAYHKILRRRFMAFLERETQKLEAK